MTHEVIRVEPDTPIGTIVEILESKRIRRVPVVENGKLVGIVSRSNLVRALGSVSSQIVPASTDDRRIRDLVIAEFARHKWGLDSENNVIVTAGIVHLWGLVSTQEERMALRVAAEGIPGVRGIQDQTILIHDESHMRSCCDPSG